ncbi:MAG: hypothetical protein OSB66_07355 [SAR202 cluster bacterium]|nr:hypothetical protein [SAR202 cluster bacterium]
MEYRANGEISALLLGLIFLIMGVTLMIYGNRMLKKTKHIGYLTLFLIFGLKQNTLACAACYGESDSPMAEGMNAGIFVLLIIIGGTLAAIAGFFLFIMQRARIQSGRDKLLRDPKLIGIRTLDLSKNTSLPRQII